MESLGTSPRSEDMDDNDSTNPIESDYNVGMGREFYAEDVNNIGMIELKKTLLFFIYFWISNILQTSIPFS